MVISVLKNTLYGAQRMEILKSNEAYKNKNNRDTKTQHTNAKMSDGCESQETFKNIYMWNM